MSKFRIFLLLFLLFWILSMLPFWVSGLNQVAPWFLGMPFTVWSFQLLVAAGCLLLSWGSKSAWDSFDDCESGEAEK